MPGQHARLAPSAAHRWLNCSGAPNLEAQFPEESSEYADEGTMLHDATKYALTRYAEGRALDFVNPIVVNDVKGKATKLNEDQMAAVKAAHDFAIEAGLLESDCWLERRYDMPEIDPEMGGTADVTHFRNKRLVVVDWKFGRGVKVEAYENGRPNPQLLSYALGAYSLLRMLGETVEEIIGVVVQPRLDHVDSFTLTPEEMAAEVAYMAGQAKLTHDPNAPRTPGDWCKFCRAKAHCPELRGKAIAMLEPQGELLPTAPELTDEQLHKVLKEAPMIRDFLKAAETEARRRIEAGIAVPGWKLVAGKRERDYRSINSTLQWIDFQSEQFQKGCFTLPEPLSPAQMEKHCKAHGVAFPVDLVIWNTGNPSLVPSSDPRPPVASTTMLEAQPSDVHPLLR